MPQLQNYTAKIEGVPINGGRQLTRGTRPDEFAALTSPG